MSRTIRCQLLDDEKPLERERIWWWLKRAQHLYTGMFSDTDLSQIDCALWHVTGKGCIQAIVHEESHDRFIERITAYAESLEIGLGPEGTDMGARHE